MSDDRTSLGDRRVTSGRLEPVWTIEVQTVPADVDRILDAVLEVHPLRYGNYDRNASVSAVGCETARPREGSTTDTHKGEFEVGDTETYPVVELKISVERNAEALDRVLAAIVEVHHYEEPVVFVREAWAHRAEYDPNSSNENRWWNDGRGMPDRIDDIAAFLSRADPGQRGEQTQ